MLRELDSIESDWAALLWAVGSMAAMFGYSAGRSWSSVLSGGYRMNEVRKRLLGFLSGAGIAALLAALAIGLLTVCFRVFPTFAEQTTWLPGLALIVLPLLSLIGIGGLVWRKNRSVAVGLFCSACALGTHFVFYVAIHGRS